MRIPVRLLATGAAALLALAAAPARAETHDSRTVTLGWMTENADAVVLGRAADERVLDARGDRRELDLLVDESIRGSVAAGTTVVIVYEGHGEAMPWKAAGVHLAFLKAARVPPGAPARWLPLSGAFSVKPIPAEGPESRFPAEVRTLASLLDAEGGVAKPDALRDHLVAGMEDGDPGFAWTAAMDFVRHAGLHAGLAREQGARIVAAFRRQPVGKRTKEALALAVACTKDPAAARSLVDALDDPRARLIRVSVAEALRRLGDPGAPKLLLAALADAGPGKRADLLRVLGLIGAVEAAPVARERLADQIPEVRTEAAQALGLMARAAREGDPAARLPGRAELEKVASSTEAAGNEARAALWALAQLDDQEAWAALRRLAAGDPREDVRRHAERYLRNPRQSLILE
jgi:HEAT repeat protein